MAGNPYRNKDERLERTLRYLEQKYDKGGEPQREFARACAEIRELLQSGKIDRDHADMLREKAKAALDAHEAKQNAKRDKQKEEAFAQAVAPLVFLMFVMFVIILIAVVACS